MFWAAALQAEPHSETCQNKTQTETVVTGYLEGNASSLICLIWLETPPTRHSPPSVRKPTEFNSRW